MGVRFGRYTQRLKQIALPLDSLREKVFVDSAGLEPATLPTFSRDALTLTLVNNQRLKHFSAFPIF